MWSASICLEARSGVALDILDATTLFLQFSQTSEERYYTARLGINSIAYLVVH